MPDLQTSVRNRLCKLKSSCALKYTGTQWAGVIDSVGKFITIIIYKVIFDIAEF